MICQTIKKGQECFFMSGDGCSYNGGSCYPVVEQCDGCAKTKEFSNAVYCNAYPQPELKWKNTACNFATHVKREVKKGQVINALKASKRRAAGKI